MEVDLGITEVVEVEVIQAVQVVQVDLMLMMEQIKKEVVEVLLISILVHPVGSHLPYWPSLRMGVEAEF